jgi:MFS family permease
MLALVVAFFAVQAGYHGFTASLPVALVKAGLPAAEIGLIVGVASVVQVPAAFFAGGLIDRFGGPRVLLFGALAYLAGAVLLALPIVQPGAGGSVAIFVAARVLQGIGVSTTTPAAFAIVPGLVDRTRVGVGLAKAGAAQNVTMAILPPVSLFVLDLSDLHAVAALIAVVVAIGALLVVRLDRALSADVPARVPAPTTADTPVRSRVRPRWVGFAWRPAWALPLLVVVSMTIHWGVITAYLAQVAEPAGANVAIFFTLDAVAVFVFRIPVGWLVDRVAPRPFVLAGLAGTLACVLLLLLPPSTPVFIVSGFFAGAGGILVIGPMLMVMAHRSTDRDRGSGFAFFYVAMALGNAIGSIGGAPLVAAGGFGLAMTALGVVGLIVSAVLTLIDGGLANRSGLPIRHAISEVSASTS